MRVHSLCQGFFFLSLLFAVSLCSADDNTFEVVGTGECADCKENNFKTSQAFSGLHVTIDCKLKNGELKRVGAGELDNEGKFKVSLPQELVEDGKKLKEECHAQLHSAAAIPCPAHNDLEASKIVLKSQTNGKSKFGPTKNLQFSAALCTSKFLWPYFKYPPLPKTHPWFKHFPKVNPPPLKNWGHPWPLPPLPPFYKPKPKPLPPPIPIYKPPPIVKPLPPPVPIYKPPPVIKPLPPPVPIYKPPKPPKEPCPPVGPKPPKPPKPPKEPCPPVGPKPPKPPKPPKQPCPPVGPKPPKPPKEPCPPVGPKPPKPPKPPKKPCPPVGPKPPKPPVPQPPKKTYPPLPKLPPFPKIPPKHFHHPKWGHFPPLPPKIPHP